MISRTRQIGLPSSPRPSRPATPNAPLSEPSSFSSHSQYTAPVLPNKHSQPPRRPMADHGPTMYISNKDTDADHTETKYNQRTRQTRSEYLQPQTSDVGLQSQSSYINVHANTDKAAMNEAEDNTYPIWNAVTKAANALTSVGNTWSSNLTKVSGEETPPGQESRLTRAMKAYYIAKARDMSDLPDWLFNEKDRLVQIPPQSETFDENQSPQLTPLPRTVSDRSEISDIRSLSGQRTRGADRLKELRDARRRAGAPDPSERVFDTDSDTRPPYLEKAPITAAVIQPRIGLPSGPQRRRR